MEQLILFFIYLPRECSPLLNFTKRECVFSWFSLTTNVEFDEFRHTYVDALLTLLGISCNFFGKQHTVKYLTYFVISMVYRFLSTRLVEFASKWINHFLMQVPLWIMQELLRKSWKSLSNTWYIILKNNRLPLLINTYGSL